MDRSMTGCLMCGATLSRLQQFQGAKFCGEPCGRRYATLPPGRSCRACGRSLSLGESVAGICATLECRCKIDEPVRERLRQERAARKQLVRELRGRHAERLGIAEPETYYPVAVPALRRRLTNLPDRRRCIFRDHLNRLISEAGESLASSSSADVNPPAAPATPDAAKLATHAVLARGCALCQGSCCRYGLNHAYLKVETIRRYMAQHPDQRPRDVLAAYLARIGNRTIDNSCVYHRADGCSLPRSMRADICNDWLCRGLTEFDHGPSRPDQPRGFFVSMDGDAIVDAAFCDVDASRIVTLSPVLERHPGPPPGEGPDRPTDPPPAVGIDARQAGDGCVASSPGADPEPTAISP